MGLFDIFKRRKPQDEETPAEQTTSETTTSEASDTESVSETQASEAEQITPTTVPDSTSTAAVTKNADAEPQSEQQPPVEATAPVETDSEAVISEAESTTPSDSSLTSDLSEDQQDEATPTAETDSADTLVVESTAVVAPSSESTTEVPETTDEQRYDQGLKKSRQTLGERFNALLANFRSVDEDFFDDLEETLIGADVGFETAVKISDELREEVKLKNAKRKEDVQNVIVEKLVDLYDAEGNGEDATIHFAKEGPTVILFVGVNGVGKTTTIGKMAKMYQRQGKKVLLAAADTFRAGAIQQLNVWAERDGVDIVKKPEGSDPAAVVYDAVDKAKRENYDILFVDTAGRLQNKVNLMNELEKMKRIIEREIPAAPQEVLLVLDSTTGQNALNQAKLFKESTAVTGIVLTKLDGTARGGIVLAIRNELHVPVKFVGLGEQVDDLRPFDANEFVYGLFKGLITR